VAVRIWPLIQGYLNELRSYSRGGITFLSPVIGVFFIPLMVANLSVINESFLKNRVYWATVFVVTCYPSLTYFTDESCCR
jgi:hypothetical protein